MTERPHAGPLLDRVLARAVRGGVPERVEDMVLDWLRPASGVVNDLDLRFLGMRRSGNHAVIGWLLASHALSRPEGRSVHLNNIPLGKNGYRVRHRFPAPIDRPEYTREMGRRRFRHLEPLTLLVRSYEDWSLDAFAVSEKQSWYGPSRTSKTFVILRDPYNLFASRTKSGKLGVKDDVDPIALYLDHARVLDGAGPSGVAAISYNRWLIDRAYREDLARSFGFERCADPPETAAPNGGGSSFAGRAAVQAPDLLTRWRSFADDPNFRESVLANEALARIMRRHFPEALPDA